MEDYTRSAHLASKVVTQTFSNSFSSAITLFDKSIQQDIYNIYGLVRIADEVVDTYQGEGAAEMLNALEIEVYAAMECGFSTNIIVHAFCMTARQYAIDNSIIKPFFQSMRTDLTKKSFNQAEYTEYIYGSAEVVGLMCLRVFTEGDQAEYERLREGACALGAAFQKVNFLRDIKDDYETRGRYYFPSGTFKTFDDIQRDTIVKDIEQDFAVARIAIDDLPSNARFATKLSYEYYTRLLTELKTIPAQEITTRRVSVSRLTKLSLLLKGKIKAHAW